MSFTGDLEHLPIVDIIQLLHAARKSGTLTVHNPKGDNQLVFRDGFIVSANNARNSVRIGRILLEINAVSKADLEQALAEQQAAGVARKPLIATLIENGLVDKDDAFKGLEILIEKTVLEVLIWKEGSFTFDVDVVNVADEYRYIPDKVKRDSQSVLMEALRQYDEKTRDGELEKEFADEEAALPAAVAAPSQKQEEPGISADILGLADIDRLERKIPDVFVGLADPEPDPAQQLRQRLAENAPGLPEAEREIIAANLEPLLPPGSQERGGGAPAGQTVILFSRDPLLSQALTVLCRHDGLLAFTTTEPQDLDMILAQSLGKGLRPLLIFDRPAGDGEFSTQAQEALRQRLKGEAPHALFIQLVTPDEAGAVYAAHASGARLTLPRPLPGPAGTGFGSLFYAFLAALRDCLQGWGSGTSGGQVEALVKSCRALKSLSEPRDVALELLKFVASIFPRALILVVGPSELVVDRGRGLAEAGETLSGARIPLVEESLLGEVCAGGQPFFGPASDPLLGEQLQRLLGAPTSPQVLLLPVTSFGKARILIYADFAERAVAEVFLPLLEVLAGEGGLVLENALYRKKLHKGPL
jgi:Domain of unknown function (DUF4388)